MFQFHQNNSQLLFHIIVSLWGAGAFSRDFTTNLARRCPAFTRALKNEKLKAPPFPGPGGAGDTNDWCITPSILLTINQDVLKRSSFDPLYSLVKLSLKRNQSNREAILFS